MDNRKSIQVGIQWRAALLGEGQPYLFPKKFTPYFRRHHGTAAVYRWRIMSKTGETTDAVYIGEAEDLAQRVRVLTPPKQNTSTNRRLHDLFQQRLSEGKTIALDVADIDPFEINDVQFGKDSVTDCFKRRTLENLLLSLAASEREHDLLNVVVDPMKKTMRLLIALSPSGRREIIERYAPSQGADAQGDELCPSK
jgi:hypothetical protein